MLCSWCIRSLIPFTTMPVRFYYSLVIDEETETQRLSDISKANQIINGALGFKCKSVWHISLQAYFFPLR